MYIGPETLMPLASVLAALAGALLLFWRRAVGVARAGVQHVSRTWAKLFKRQ